MGRAARTSLLKVWATRVPPTDYGSHKSSSRFPPNPHSSCRVAKGCLGNCGCPGSSGKQAEWWERQVKPKLPRALSSTDRWRLRTRACGCAPCPGQCCNLVVGIAYPGETLFPASASLPLTSCFCCPLCPDLNLPQIPAGHSVLLRAEESASV